MSKFRVKKTKNRLAHQIAFCSVCDMRWENYKTARKNARNHTEKTGHATCVENSSIFDYKINPQQ